MLQLKKKKVAYLVPPANENWYRPGQWHVNSPESLLQPTPLSSASLWKASGCFPSRDRAPVPENATTEAQSCTVASLRAPTTP